MNRIEEAQIDHFFDVYWSPGMKDVYTEFIPKEMMVSVVDDEGWYEWKPMKGLLKVDDYRSIEKRFGATLPDNFINWHKKYFFADGDCSIVRLPESMPTKPLEKVIRNLDWYIAEQLIPHGLIPFADEGNDVGPLVFDTRNQTAKIDYPIRIYDHSYMGDLKGLSDVIFSSFERMVECLSHFLVETKERRQFEVIPEFYKIDPKGAGHTGKTYWDSCIEMGKANYEEFGY